MSAKVSQSINRSSIWKWIRHCAHCGVSMPPIEWLCQSCLKKLKSCYLEPQNMLRLQSHFRHCRLIDWNDKNDQFIRSIIQSLKGPQGSPLFSILALEFFLRLQHIPDVFVDHPFALIPCPAKSHLNIFFNLKKKLINTVSFFCPKQHSFSETKTSFDLSVDHSFFWAQCLSEKTNYPIASVLSHPESKTAQKKKNLLLRKQKHFIFKDPCSLPQGHSIIFVDDVVTSGSTAYAAYKALGSPKPFMIWSLFWRKPRERNEYL